MNYKLILGLTGRALMLEAASLLLPLLVCLFYREDPSPFIYSIAIIAALSRVLSLFCGGGPYFSREGFFSVGLVWVLVSALGALPFCFSGCFPSWLDCLFESISGFTTTGATVLGAVEGLPRGILFWRALTHWLGGMGILVLVVALLPSLGGRTFHLMRAETPGPLPGKLVPKVSQTSKILYAMYTALTLLQTACLLLAGLPLYDSVVTALSTAGTGGFAVRNTSIAAYASSPVYAIVAVFMLLFSVNFSLYFLLIHGKVRQALKNDELRFFAGVVLFSTVLITLNIRPLYTRLSERFLHAFFQVASIISTTGFASTDFNQWPEFSRIVLLMLMLCGACAGSTGGGIKCVRVLIAKRLVSREVLQIVHPRSVSAVTLDGKALDEPALWSFLLFLVAYLGIVLGAAVLVALNGFSFTTTLTAVVTCMGNVGPGLDAIGPMGNFSIFSPLSKIILSFCMIAGRLEIFPVLVLFNREAWRQS